MNLSRIEHIAQDSMGYIWIGARNGIARFDGVQFNYYFPDASNPNAIPFSDISNITCDPKGNIWVGSHEGGIAIYDFHTDSFRTFDLEDYPYTKRPLMHLTFDREGIGYATFHNHAIYRFELEEERLRIDSIFDRDLLFLNIEFIPDEDNKLLLSTNNGIFKLDLHSYQLDTIYPLLQWYDSHRANGKIYGYNYSDNIHYYDLQSQKIVRLEDEFKNRRKHIINVGSEIWATNGNQGVVRFDENDKLIENFELIPLSNNTLGRKDNSYVLFKDRDNGIWVGRDRDLLYLTPSNEKVKSYTTYTDHYETTYDAFKINKDRYLIATVYERHILDYDLSTNSSRKIVSKNKDSNPKKIEILNNDTLVFYSRTIGKYQSNPNRITPYLDRSINEELKKHWFVNVTSENENEIWILDAGYRLIQMFGNDSIRIYPILKEIPEDHFPRTITRYDEDTFIIGGSASIAVYSLKNGLLNYMHLDQTDFASTINYILVDTTISDNKQLWISSYSNSLFRSELKNNKISILQKYDMKSGLLNSRPGELILTAEGDLIVSTSIGLAMYDQNDDRFIAFSDNHKFLGSNIVYVREIDNKIFVFQEEGFSILEKSAFKQKEDSPKLYIDQVLVNSEPLDLRSAFEDITLSHNEKSISIQFSALNFQSPQDVYYAYRLNNGDWVKVNYLEKTARFGQLESGKYTFSVKARTSNSDWTKTTSIQFEILPPFWKTWWFLTICAIIVSVILFGYIKWRERNLNKLSQYEKRLIELENEALRAQMNPHFIFNSLNSIKAFIIRNEPDSAADYLTLFAELIRVILHNSKQKMISLAAEIEAVDLYAQLENIRLDNKFEVVWNVKAGVDTHAVLIPPLTFQPFIENAIWHGFIHKQAKGKLEIDIYEEDQFLRASIVDDGIGRVKSRAIEGKKSGNKKSYGIAITKQRLDQNNKKERVKIIDLYDESNNAKGTQVVLTIDLKKKVKS